MDEKRTIEQCQAGDRDAFGRLVQRYQTQAIGHALAVLCHREDALDAVQESFLRAFRAIRTLDSRRTFYPWFYTILRHRCFDMLKERKRTPAAGFDDVRFLTSASSPANDDRDPILERALKELSAEDRELLTLKHLDGLNYEQLAERMGVPPGTVMSRLFHARRRLREKVQRMQQTLDREGTCHDGK